MHKYQCMESSSYNCEPDIPDMTAKLYQICVDEILGDHCAMYERFVQPIEDYKEVFTK